MPTAGVPSARTLACASMGSATRRWASAPVSPAGGAPSVPVPAIAASTLSVTNRRGLVSVSLAGGAAAATTSVRAATLLVSSLQGAANVVGGPLALAVTATASATWADATSWMGHALVTQATVASSAENRVQPASTDRAAGDGKNHYTVLKIAVFFLFSLLSSTSAKVGKGR